MRKPKGSFVFAVVCIACIWGTAAFYFFWHEPQQKELGRMLAQQSDEKQKLLGITNFMNAHRDLEGYRREATDRRERSARAIPGDMMQGDFLSSLQRLALGTHVELMGVVPGAEAMEKNVAVLPVQVKMKCNYFQLLDFVKGLQEGERFLQIRNARIQSDGGRLICQLDLAIFSMR